LTLHPIPFDFLIYEENFIFFFISVPCTQDKSGKTLKIHAIREITRKYKNKQIPLKTKNIKTKDVLNQILLGNH